MKSRFFPVTSPWVFFGVFLCANTMLSYFPFSLEAKLWIGFFGILLPFLWALWRPLKRQAGPFFQKEFLPPLPAWVWALLGACVVFLRFYQLTTLSVWPHYDEGVYGYYALQLDKQWSWRLFYGDSCAPPLYVWLLSLFFKIFGVSLTTLWALPALISVAVVPASYAAARRFFSGSFSFLCACLMAFSFWPLFLGRFSFMTGLVLLGECAVLCLLGWFLRAPSLLSKKKAAAALGLMMGLGFLIHIHWPVIVAAVLGTLLADLKISGKASQQVAFFWMVPLLALSLPLLVLEWTQGYGAYLAYLAPFHLTHSLGNQWNVSRAYLSSLFWGADPAFHTYQPVWGGFLNPLLDSFFFVGLLELLRGEKSPISLWLLVAFVVFLLPGLLTSEPEFFRMVPLIPVLLVVTALGGCRLAAGLCPPRAALGAALCLAVSIGLDGFHLFGAYHRLWDSSGAWRGYAKSMERYRAYELLEQWAREKGPGLIFSDFVPGLPDQTLKVATYSFNAAQNPSLDPQKARWAAVLANANEQPFLARRFPDGKYAWLSKGEGIPDGGYMLWVMPLEASRDPVLELWRKADSALGPFLDEAISYYPDKSLAEIRWVLEDVSADFQADPFLASCFWEKEAEMLFKEYSSVPDPQTLGRAEKALQEALRQGYPSAHLFLRLGVFYLLSGDPVQARRAFEEALGAPGNRTDAASYLKGVSPQAGNPKP